MATLQFEYPLLNSYAPGKKDQLYKIQFGGIDHLTVDRSHGHTLVEMNIMTKRENGEPLIIEIWQGEIYCRYSTENETVKWDGLGIPIGLCDQPTKIKFSRQIILVTLGFLIFKKYKFDILRTACRYRTKTTWWTIQEGNSLKTNEEDVCVIKMQTEFELCFTNKIYTHFYGDTFTKIQKLPLPSYAYAETNRIFIPDDQIQHFNGFLTKHGLPVIPAEDWIPYLHHGEILKSKGDKTHDFLEKLERFKKSMAPYVKPPLVKKKRILDTRKKDTHGFQIPPPPRAFLSLEERIRLKETEKKRREIAQRRQQNIDKPTHFGGDKYRIIHR